MSKTLTPAAQFSRRLRELIDAKETSPYQLAKDCEVSASVIHNILTGTTGRKGPGWDLVVRIADALGVKTEAFR